MHNRSATGNLPPVLKCPYRKPLKHANTSASTYREKKYIRACARSIKPDLFRGWEYMRVWNVLVIFVGVPSFKTLVIGAQGEACGTPRILLKSFLSNYTHSYFLMSS